MTAGGETPTAAGQLSPDGMWRWDGARWVPTGAIGQASPRGRSRSWIWWLGGGCLLVVLVVIVAIVVSGAALIKSFQSGGFTCLPGDFPQYPGATVAAENNSIGRNAVPGDSRECEMTLDSNDDVTTVTAFYESQLNSGDWTVITNDTSNGVIRTSRKSRPATVGEIQLFGRGQHTEIQIRLDS